MKKIILLLLFSLSIQGLQAQYYKSSAGLRLGGTTGIVYKNFVMETSAYELMASGRNGGFQVTALYEYYIPTKISPNLFLFYGVGTHIGFERYRDRTQIITRYDGTQLNSTNYFSMGIDGILGFEYRLKAPVTIGMNVKPKFSFLGMRFTQLQFWDTALTVTILI